MVLTRTVGKAMAAQVARVNAPTSDADLRQQLREAQEDLRTAERQRDAFAKRNGELLAECEQLRAALAQIKHPTVISSFTVDNRPVMTAAEAAHWVGVSVATVSRYIEAGYWHATRQPGSNRWLIFCDEPLPVKRRRA